VALVDQVTARYATAYLVALTRQVASSDTTVDATRLAAAAADAEARFGVVVGVPYDDSDAEHVQAACAGVIYYLTRWLGTSDDAAGALRAQFEDALRELALARGTRRSVLASSSTPVNRRRSIVDDRYTREYRVRLDGR
jgi:phage gp36-like protein